MAFAPPDTEFLIAELEDQKDYDGILAGIEQMPSWMDDIPKAVVTTFVPLRDGFVPLPEKAQPLIDAGFACLTECDMPANPNQSPPRMDFSAQTLGWDYSIPGFYCQNGFRPETHYAEWMDWQWGWWTWLAEYVL